MEDLAHFNNLGCALPSVSSDQEYSHWVEAPYLVQLSLAWSEP